MLGFPLKSFSKNNKALLWQIWTYELLTSYNIFSGRSSTYYHMMNLVLGSDDTMLSKEQRGSRQWTDHWSQV